MFTYKIYLYKLGALLNPTKSVFFYLFKRKHDG